MSVYIEEEGALKLPVDVRGVAELVAEAALDYVRCPYEAEVNLLLTGDREIREMNRDFRQTDKATDVLSFPMLQFSAAGDFSAAEAQPGAFHPESGELLLGDIVISKEHVMGQAQAYGHSPKREFAFLIAHSMLHLCGYDHMEEGQRQEMEQKQREILEGIHILR